MSEMRSFLMVGMKVIWENFEIEVVDMDGVCIDKVIVCD